MSIRDLMSGEAQHWGAGMLRAGLRAASWGYGLGARTNRTIYNKGWRTIHHAPLPVISIGNLTAGGTGKTPLVAWLAETLQSQGRRIAILSRGYGAAPGELNDEGQLLARRLPEARLYQHPDRVASAHQAAKDGCDIAILDDGFQHRRLHRNLDILTIDATCPFGFDALLPRGLLREPLSSAARADAIAITRCELVNPGVQAAITARLREAGAHAPAFEVRFEPATLSPLPSGPNLNLESLKDKPAWLACAIGNPKAFERTLRKLGADIRGTSALPDHHLYTPLDISAITSQAQDAGATTIIVTEKDAVKLTRLLSSPPTIPWHTLTIHARPQPLPTLLTLIQNAISSTP